MEASFSCQCKYCGKVVATDSAGSFVFHADAGGGKCYGSYQPAMPLIVSWWVKQKQRDRQAIQMLTDMSADVTADIIVPEPDITTERQPWEMCKGGPKPRTGCVACGDMMYMASTERPRRESPDSHGEWQAEYERYGIPWAKERMESYVTLAHSSVLDPGWKPRPVISTAPIAPRIPVISRFGIVMGLISAMFMVLSVVLFIPLLIVPAVIAGYFTVADLADGHNARRRMRK